MLDSTNFSKLQDAIQAYNERDHEAAFSIFEYLSSGALKDDEAQYYLGLMYFNGHFVAKNKEKALLWWKKSAKSRNEDAIFQLESLSMTRNTRY